MGINDIMNQTNYNLKRIFWRLLFYHWLAIKDTTTNHQKTIRTMYAASVWFTVTLQIEN